MNINAQYNSVSMKGSEKPLYNITRKSIMLPFTNREGEISIMRNSDGAISYLSAAIGKKNAEGKAVLERATNTIMRGTGLKNEEIAEFKNRVKDICKYFADETKPFGNTGARLRAGFQDGVDFLKEFVKIMSN